MGQIATQNAFAKILKNFKSVKHQAFVILLIKIRYVWQICLRDKLLFSDASTLFPSSEVNIPENVVIVQKKKREQVS